MINELVKYPIIYKNKITSEQMSGTSDAYLHEISQLQQKIDLLEKEVLQSKGQNQLQVQRLNQFQAQIHSKNQ